MTRSEKHFRDRPNKVKVIDDEKKQALFLDDFNWVAPEADILDPPYNCYKINIDWQPFIMGFVSHLNTVAVWGDAVEDNYIGIDQINKFLAQVNDCMRLRQNPSNLCQLEQSLDGGATWEIAFDYGLCLSQQKSSDYLDKYGDDLTAIESDYDGTVASIAPDAIYDGSPDDAIRNIVLCETLGYVIWSACQIEKARREDVALNVVGSALLMLVIGIVSLVSGMIMTPFILAVAGGLMGSLAGIFDEISDELLDDNAVQEAVKCCAYNALKNGTLTYEGLRDSLDNCGFTFGTSEAQMAGAIAYILGEEKWFPVFLDQYQYYWERRDWWNFADCNCLDTSAFTVTFDTLATGDWFLQINNQGATPQVPAELQSTVRGNPTPSCYGGFLDFGWGVGTGIGMEIVFTNPRPVNTVGFDYYYSQPSSTVLARNIYLYDESWALIGSYSDTNGGSKNTWNTVAPKTFNVTNCKYIRVNVGVGSAPSVFNSSNTYAYTDNVRVT